MVFMNIQSPLGVPVREGATLDDPEGLRRVEERYRSGLYAVVLGTCRTWKECCRATAPDFETTWVVFSQACQPASTIASAATNQDITLDLYLTLIKVARSRNPSPFEIFFVKQFRAYG